MKQKIWLILITCLAYCINKELYKAIDYLREQVRVLVEYQEKQNKRILLNNHQRIAYLKNNLFADEFLHRKALMIASRRVFFDGIAILFA